MKYISAASNIISIGSGTVVVVPASGVVVMVVVVVTAAAAAAGVNCSDYDDNDGTLAYSTCYHAVLL